MAMNMNGKLFIQVKYNIKYELSFSLFLANALCYIVFYMYFELVQGSFKAFLRSEATMVDWGTSDFNNQQINNPPYAPACISLIQSTDVFSSS
jgi:hypothetical protein